MRHITDKLEEYKPHSDFEPLQVIFSMRSPIMLGHPFIHADGLILHLLYRDVLGNDYYSLPSKEPLDLSCYIQPPMKRTNKVYNASVSIFDTDTKFATTIYKRFCTEYLQMLKTKKQKITRGSGFFRDYMMKMVYVPAKTIFFYINGDKNEIKRLMFNVVSLGKKTSYGFGRIKSMSIKTIDKDYSLIKDNKAMRPIPTSMLRYAETKMLMAYKPPYWSKNNVDMCAFPNTGVKIG